MKKILVLISIFLMISVCFMNISDATASLNLLAQSPDYTQTMTTVCVDNYYVYAGGSNINTVTKYDKNTLGILGVTSSIGGSVACVIDDNSYLYVCGFNNKVSKISKSSLGISAQSPALASTYSSLSDDETYLYVGSDANTRVYQLFKSDMTQKAVTSDLSVAIYSVTNDENYVYAGGNGKLWQFYISNMTTKTTLSVSSPYSISQDTLYLYTGDSSGNIKQYWKSNMTEKQRVSYGGIVYGISIDADCLYGAGASTEVIRQYYLTNFTLIANSSNYGGTINAITNNEDSIYICGATTRKVNKYLKSYITPTTPSGENETYNSIYFKFYDITTNNIIHWKGAIVDNSEMGILDYTNCYLLSTYFPTGYGNDEYFISDVMTMNFNFTDSIYATFYLSGSLSSNNNFLCNINGIDIFFKYKTISLKLYAGQTYNIYLEPTYFIDGVSYSYCGGNDKTNGLVSVCLTKSEFAYGETIRMQYTLPSGNWLNNNGWLTTGWYFAFYNRDDYFFGLRLDNWQYVNRYQLTPNDFDGNRHTYEFDLTQYQNPDKSNTIYGYDKYYNDYEIAIVNFNAGWFDKTYMFDNLIFYCTGDVFSPNGTITSITPNPCYIGQPVTISWLSNGVGALEITYPNGEIYFRTNYGYSTGIHMLTKTITAIGTLAVNLYTISNLVNNTIPVDTDTLFCNQLGINGTYGSYGYGVPYLYIPIYRGIAGYDTIYIYYRTYKNDSKLEIKSPRGETSFFSTTVSNQSDNILSIELQTYMQLGVWEVTLYGGDINGTSITLLSDFNVVNEENNWIEFSKHQYVSGEPFTLFVKHSYRVALTFYKNDIAQGETLIFNVGENDNTLYTVPIEKVSTSNGNWRVEMWRINDRNQVYELAEWNCIVIQGKYIPPASVGGFFGIIIPPFVMLILGIITTLLITMLPLIIGLALSRKKGGIPNIPALLYVAFFFFGLIVSVLFGFIDIVVPFIILLGLIIAFAVMWIRGKATGE